MYLVEVVDRVSMKAVKDHVIDVTRSSYLFDLQWENEETITALAPGKNNSTLILHIDIRSGAM